MITSLWVDNFKSLVDFHLPLAKFNCVVGLNGSGKSTVLQALDFVSQLMRGDIEGWLKLRHWDSSDLNSKLTKKNNIEFRVGLDLGGSQFVWFGSFNRTSLSCTKEVILENEVRVLSVEDGHYTYEGKRHEIMFEYQGSILSRLKNNLEDSRLGIVKNAILHINSLDLISPELLRSQNRTAEGKLGLGGEKLSAYIHEAGLNAQQALTRELAHVYPQLKLIKTKSLKSGWKQLQIDENFNGRKLVSAARHVNDGMLRLMAILMQLEIGKAFLMFDEIENGINPELIEYLIDHLVNSDDQVLVTTHSPMVLNFMEDSIARKGVIFLYKTDDGFTQAVRLFDVASMNKKLDFMGPGEAFIDTDLTQLSEEIKQASGKV